MSKPNQTPPSLDEAIASLRAQHAGRAGRGKVKRRGDSAYYKALAAKRRNPGRKKGS